MNSRLYNGDCKEVMTGFDDSSVDLIIADFPYYKVKGEAWDRQWDTVQGFLDWMDTILEQFYRVMKPNGSLYVFASPEMGARVEVLIREHFCVLNNITWQKPAYSTKAEMFRKDWMRSYFPASERIVFAEHYGADGYAKGEAGYTAKVDELRGFVFEPIRAYLAGERDRAGLTTRKVAEAFQRKTGSRTVTGMAGHWFEQVQWTMPTEENYQWLRVTFSNLNHGGEYLKRDYEDLKRDYEDLKRDYEDLKRDYEDLRRPFSVSADVPYTDVWTFKTVQAYKGKHPCEKPLEMLEHIVSASSKPGAVVLDPFMGTGNSGRAALRLGREFIGIEKDEKYFSTAERRINENQMEFA